MYLISGLALKNLIFHDIITIEADHANCKNCQQTRESKNEMKTHHIKLEHVTLIELWWSCSEPPQHQ